MHAMTDLRVWIGHKLRMQSFVDRLSRSFLRHRCETRLRPKSPRTFASDFSGRSKSYGDTFPRRPVANAGRYRVDGNRKARSTIYRHLSIQTARIFHASVYVIDIESSAGSRCHTRLNSHGCWVPSYHCGCRQYLVNEHVALAFAFRRPFKSSRLVPGVSQVFPPSLRRSMICPNQRARLRRINPVRINWRPFHVINFPAGKMGPVHLPIFALRIRRENERAFPCADQ